MKIYRAIGKKEEKALLEGKDILFEHKTVLKEEWLMFEHEEDYNSGKFFFFTIEDANLFIRYRDVYEFDSSIIEMDIDDKDAFRYIGCGKYSYGDFIESGWNADVMHSVPELFLPYDLIKDKIKNNDYRLITYADRENSRIGFPYNSIRSKCFFKLSEVMSSICSVKSDIFRLEKIIKESSNSSAKLVDDLNEYKEKLENYKVELLEVYKEFVDEHNLYVCPVKEKKGQMR